MPLDCVKAGLRWRVSWMLVGLSGALGALFGAQTLSPVINGPTVYLRDTTVLSPIVVPGESLRLRIKAAVKSDSRCTGYVIREFYHYVKLDDVSLREKYRLTVGSPPIPLKDEAEYIVLIPTPRDMPTGQWQFHGRTTLDCGVLFGGIRHYDTPFLDFVVAQP